MTVLYRMVRGGLIQMTPEERLKGIEEVSYVDIWGKGTKVGLYIMRQEIARRPMCLME